MHYTEQSTQYKSIGYPYANDKKRSASTTSPAERQLIDTKSRQGKVFAQADDKQICRTVWMRMTLIDQVGQFDAVENYPLN